MDLHAKLWQRLTTAPAVTAVLGNRIWPNKLPDKAAMPAVVYVRSNTDRDRNLAGPSGLTTAVLELHVIAAKPEEAEQIADIVRANLDGFQGPMGDVWVWEISVDGQEAGYDPDLDRHFIVLTISIEHAE